MRIKVNVYTLSVQEGEIEVPEGVTLTELGILGALVNIEGSTLHVEEDEEVVDQYIAFDDDDTPSLVPTKEERQGK